MKQKKRILFIVFLFVLGLELQAQTLLNVNEKSGTRTSFALSGLNKLIFSSGNMIVSMKGGNFTNFALANISTLNFKTITAIAEINHDDGNLKLYPNPVHNFLTIQVESDHGEDVFILIMDIQGRVLFQQTQLNQSGLCQAIIPVESFQQGMYLCRIQHGKKLEINKFIKN